MTEIVGFAELEAAQQLLLASLAGGLEADDVVPAMQRLEAFRNSLCRADHALILAADAHGLAERFCVSSVEKLVAQALRIPYGEAKRRVRAATALGPRISMLGEVLPPARTELAAAQANGELGPLMVDVIEQTLAKVELVAPDQVAETEAVLVSYGRAFEPGEVGKICDRVLDHVDPDGRKPRDAALRDRRGLHLARCRDGMIKLDGRLTPATGARVKAILEPLAAPRPSIEAGPQGGEKVTPDSRSREQRLHDALDEASARLLRAGDAPASGGTPATVIITMTEEQLQAAARVAGERTPEPFRRSDPRDRPVDPMIKLSDVCADGGLGGPAGTVETSTGEVLSVAEALRLAAEAEVVPVVMSAAGRPLNLGRTRRCASRSQTLALVARDGGCSFPGCTIPPEWCERHHIRAWASGGRTDVDNLTLLCGYHHAHFAQAGWACALDPGGLPVWRPPRWQQRDRRPLMNHRIRERHGVRQL